MLTSLLVLLVTLSAAIHIRAEYRGPRQVVYVFKPLTMALIWLLAILGQATPELYKVMILAGLLCSTAGDVLLMLPSDRFVAGLVAFLIGHLFYISAFGSQLSGLAGWPLIPLAICGALVYGALSASLGRLRAPVLIYVVAILIMAWCAWERWLQTGQRGALLAFLGAILFMLSDIVLAFNRFRAGFRLARALNLVAYFAGQLLIAGSTGSLG